MSGVGDGPLQGQIGEGSIAVDGSTAPALWTGKSVDRVWWRGRARARRLAALVPLDGFLAGSVWLTSSDGRVAGNRSADGSALPRFSSLLRLCRLVIVVIDNCLLKVSGNADVAELYAGIQCCQIGGLGDACKSAASGGGAMFSAGKRFFLEAVIIEVRHGSAEPGFGTGSRSFGHGDGDGIRLFGKYIGWSMVRLSGGLRGP